MKLEEVLLTWFKEVEVAGINIDGKVHIKMSLGIENLQASGCWVHCFKAKHGLAYERVCGKSKKVDESVITDYGSRQALSQC